MGDLSSHNSLDPSTWLAPGRCKRCRHVFDSGPVEVVARYADCTMFKCPGCDASIDDRPIGWGGSFEPLSRDEAIRALRPDQFWAGQWLDVCARRGY